MIPILSGGRHANLILLVMNALFVGVAMQEAGYRGKHGSMPAGVAHAAQMSTAVPAASPSTQGVIDGLVTPERIPDTVAYSLFFNFFSDRADSERAKLQSYCRQTTLAGVDLNALLAVAQHYRQRVADVDARAQAVRADGVEQPRVQAQLALLQAEKDAIIQDVIASLPTLVGPDAAAAIRTHVNERVKRKTKIVPGPKMPDGMPGHTRP